MNVDEAVKKSLYDKDINSVVYNPNIVINESNKTIMNKVQELLKRSTRVDIAISYVVWSGLSLIYDDLKKFGSDSRLILTIEGAVTDPTSLKKLNELKMQIKVYVPYVTKQGFHLKTYMFENGDNRTLLIGSSNISARAFGLAHEMAVEIDAKSKGFIVEEYNNVFNDLWNNDDTQCLTQEFIDGYAVMFHEKKILDKYESINFINKNEIKPNYMQDKALKALEECRQNNKKGLVIAATGTGKTYLSAFDVRNSNAKKVLFLVHNRLILTSAKNTFEQIFKNKKLTELSSETKDDINKSDFIFTTDKTAQSHLVNKVSKDYFDYIIIDEAHKIGSETQYEKIINYFTPKFILGLTATPERTDNSDFLFKTFDYSVPYEIRLLDAMRNELVCPFTYYGLNLEKPLLESNEEFNYEELAKYLNNLILEKGHYGDKLKCLIFCSNKKEAMNVSIELNKIGYKSDFVVSGSNNKSREKIEELIQDLQSNELGTIEILCTVNMFNEGIDIPDINTIIMLRNTMSSIIYIQQLGRGLRRTFDPHKYVTVLDIIGNSKNNYSIAQVLSGNTTVDKRKLYIYTHNNFQTVSPFINVIMEKEVMEKIIKSISNNFTVKTQIKEKFRNELYRFKEIPSLLEMYLNESFNELDLLQLLFKNFYDPFEDYYFKKYDIPKENKFIDNFFTLITQFVFRSYDEKTLSDYVKLLKGERIKNDILRRILLPNELPDG
ncbi:MAG: DEAD/DEAH box helicase family protein, partial [Clostridia bacterium]